MGLDIYAGTLTRYYSHNWKTVVQQWAEENGYSFNRITPDGEPADNEEEMSPAEVQAAVENWRDQILSAISQPGQPPYAPWLENNEKPYYTDKPDWDAFGAMLLVAACRTYEEPVPSTVEKDWIFGEHPLVARLASDEERVWSLFRGATWWLPLSDSFLFQGSLPTDDTAAIATLGGLRKELEKLNQLAWQADEDTILGWADTEGYPVDGTVDSDGQYSKAEELDQVVEPFVQAKRQTGQWTQEDEAGYQLYRQETDPKKRTFRVWYLIANPRGLPKEFVQKELEFRWKLFPEKKEEPK